MDAVVLPEVPREGLAYRAKAPVDWCPACNTTLAREQVWGEDRHCERCETPVIRKDLEQWFFRITNYADELLDFSEDRVARARQGHADATGSAAARARRSTFAAASGEDESRCSPPGPTPSSV